MCQPDSRPRTPTLNIFLGLSVRVFPLAFLFWSVLSRFIYNTYSTFMILSSPKRFLRQTASLDAFSLGQSENGVTWLYLTWKWSCRWHGATKPARDLVNLGHIYLGGHMCLAPMMWLLVEYRSAGALASLSMPRLHLRHRKHKQSKQSWHLN
jgi:hypothetical protein